PRDLQGVFETVSWKVGLVLVVLGSLHFFNLYLFTRTRKRALEEAEFQRRARLLESGGAVPQ
ncbi:MAG TPA: hypothetical protein VMT52_03910, partial [Planctomycetota bacterium]|nr:hypothetical protein [Planctomycetota bacterium]